MLTRASPLASTSRLCIEQLLRRTASKDSKRQSAGASSAKAEAKREAYYARMNVSDDTRILDLRDALYGLRLDPKKAEAYEQKRAKALADAMPGGAEVFDTVVNAWLEHKQLRADDDRRAARRRYDALRKALDDLERVDPVRFERAVARPACQAVADVGPDHDDDQGRLPGLFPRQFRVPTYTPGRVPFNDEWRRREDLAEDPPA